MRSFEVDLNLVVTFEVEELGGHDTEDIQFKIFILSLVIRTISCSYGFSRFEKKEISQVYGPFD
jgi:hypothetical protein